MFLKATRELTHHGTLAMLSAAIEKAEAIGRPQCIVIVDASGETLGEIRMTGAKFLSRKSALAKARTAASNRMASDALAQKARPHIELATQLNVTGLPGGLPIAFEGEVIGGIGVGSGSGEEDLAVARAALAAIGADEV